MQGWVSKNWTLEREQAPLNFLDYPASARDVGRKVVIGKALPFQELEKKSGIEKTEDFAEYFNKVEKWAQANVRPSDALIAPVSLIEELGVQLLADSPVVYLGFDRWDKLAFWAGLQYTEAWKRIGGNTQLWTEWKEGWLKLYSLKELAAIIGNFIFRNGEPQFKQTAVTKEQFTPEFFTDLICKLFAELCIEIARRKNLDPILVAFYYDFYPEHKIWQELYNKNILSREIYLSLPGKETVDKLGLPGY